MTSHLTQSGFSSASTGGSLVQEFSALVQHRDACALYLLRQGKPQDLRLFQTRIDSNRRFIEPTPISTVAFFHHQWRQHQRSVDDLLAALHRGVHPLKKILCHNGLEHVYIGSLQGYLGSVGTRKD